jgi:hypothetical protein
MTLEQQIAAALNDPNMGSAELAELTSETEAAISLADQAAIQARESSLDLATDPKAAHAAIVEAELSRDRLKTVLPKLRERLASTIQSELHDKWLAGYQRVKMERDQLDSEFAEAYPRLASELADLFDRVLTCEVACNRVNHEASEFSGEMRRLHLDPSEIGSTELPGHWPPHKPGGKFNGLATAYASMMVPAPHPGANWGDPNNSIVQEQRRAVERNQAASAAHHIQAARDEEERINRQERERFAKRGPYARR